MTRINARARCKRWSAKRTAQSRRLPPGSLAGFVVCGKCERWWESGEEPESRRCPCGAFLPEFEG